MKKWEIQNTIQVKDLGLKNEDLLEILLENRGIKTREEREAFLDPKLADVTVASVGIDKTHLAKALKRIILAIEKKEQIVVFGDYDVDGICGSAILWETLYALGAVAIPFIPHRIDEGYGLSIKGIENLKEQITTIGLIITVDNGIVANAAVDFANEQGIDVIITDHHTTSSKMPNAHAIVHTTKLCGTGVAWLLSQELKCVILNSFQDPKQKKKEMLNQVQHDKVVPDDHLGLVAMATIADLVPLTGANRIVTKFGLEVLRMTKRVGLLELFKEAVINQESIDVYTIGHIIGPRLNAMGRMEYAMDSLRLLCTNNQKRAQELAMKLGSTNRDRQVLTQESALFAKQLVAARTSDSHLLFIAHESFQAGVIGLIAGRLVEEFYKPAIVLSIGETHAKASARSISGFNIIEFIRTASEHLVDAGGHPMAAGFTVEKGKLAILKETLEKKIQETLDEALLTRTLKIDCELPFPCIDISLHKALQTLSPFGMGNPEPTFVSKGVRVDDVRLIGRDKKHLKLKCGDGNCSFDAVAFGMGERIKELPVGGSIDIVYTIDENEWNGRKNLQLKIKDVHSQKNGAEEVTRK